MLISIRHVTRYTYPEPAAYSVQSLRLQPPAFRGQKVLAWSIKTSAPGQPLRFVDGFGNAVELIAINTPHRELVIEAAGQVETENFNGVVHDLVSGAPPRVFLKETPQTLADAAIRTLAREIADKDQLAAMHALAERIAAEVPYEKGMTDAHTCAADALAVEQHLALVLRDQLHHDAGSCRLAAAGFADDAERLAFQHREIDAVDGAHHGAAAEREMLRQGARLQQRGPCPTPVAVVEVRVLRHDQPFTSIADRRPSESRLNEIEVMKIATPGSAATQGWT